MRAALFALSFLSLLASCHAPPPAGQSQSGQSQSGQSQSGQSQSGQEPWTCFDTSGAATRAPFEGFKGAGVDGNSMLAQPIRDRARDLRPCVDDALASQQSVDGELAFDVSFDASGRVSKTCVSPSRALSRPLAACLAAVLQRSLCPPSFAPLSLQGSFLPSRLPPARPAIEHVRCRGGGGPMPSPDRMPKAPGPPPPPRDKKLSSADRLLAGATGQARTCYSAALTRDSSAEGKLAVSLALGPVGEITGLCTGRAGLDDDIQECMADALSALPFTAPEGGAATVTTTFSFVNAADEPPWPFPVFVRRPGG